MLFVFVCPVCVSLVMSRRQHHMSSKWSSAQHSNKQIVTGNKQIDVCAYTSTCSQRNVLTKSRVFQIQGTLSSCDPVDGCRRHWRHSVLSVFMSYLGTLESGIVPSSLVLKNHHLILTASVFSQQVLCPSKKCEEKHQPQKMHPQVTFWEASTPKILTETTEIGQLQRCNERQYSFLRNKFHVRLENKFL